MCSHIASLSETFPTSFARVWPLACVPSLVCLLVVRLMTAIDPLGGIPLDYRVARSADHKMALCTASRT